jgi:hypothetical protein
VTVIYAPVGGEITLKKGAIGDNTNAQWFNPRNGERTPAALQTGADSITVRAPDEQDWVLVLQAA